MDDLFRFVMIRGAQSADPGAAIPLVGSSGTTPFQDELRPLRGPGGFLRMAAQARKYQMEAGPRLTPPSGFADPVSTLAYGAKMASFASALEAPMPPVSPAALNATIKGIFGMDAAKLAAGAPFRSDMDRVHDSLVALFLAPSSARISPNPLAAIARMMALIVRVAQNDGTLNSSAAVADALQRTLLLPPTLFPIDPQRRLKPAGVADLLVVRQHLKGYAAGEVCHIENLLAGASRSHTEKHTLTTEVTTTVEAEKTKETAKDLRTTERFELKREVENTLKQDFSVKASVDTSVKLGTNVEISANVSVAYNTAKEDAVKSASNFAREVVTRATSKVTERIKTQEVNKAVETFYDEEDHTFDNSSGTKPVRGVYQWVNKVSSAQVFNYGKRMLFDLTVPEPAAFLLAGATARPGKPEAPPALTDDGLPGGKPILPEHLTPGLSGYGKLVQRYGVTGVAPPPPDHAVVSLSIEAAAATPDAEGLLLSGAGEVTIPEGYYLSGIRLRGAFTPNSDAAHGITLYVGSRRLTSGTDKEVAGSAKESASVENVWPEPPAGAVLLVGEIPESEGLVGTVPVALEAFKANNCALNLELLCKQTTTRLDQWKLETFSAIVQGYHRANAEFRDKLDAYNSFSAPARSLPGESPDENRSIERRELKKAAVQLLSGRDLVTQPLGAVNDAQPPERKFPNVDLAKAQAEGSYVRFFEQAFEWEQMTYFFYPYYWGRKETWYDKALMQHDDPLFREFLKAGEARVVVPVRPGFESDVWYYLMTDQIWSGGDLPAIGDRSYLPIVEEIKAVQGAPGDEQPAGDPWDVVLPTKLILLRGDGKLPAWMRQGDWTWVDDTDPSHYI